MTIALVQHTIGDAPTDALNRGREALADAAASGADTERSVMGTRG